ncbi:MAG: ACP S-malonyltransferase [Thermodesulfobacteriota bacterium]
MAIEQGRRIAVLFPGQGSQHVGMGQDFLASRPGARQIMEEAGAIAGLPLESLCCTGPLEALTELANVQPAITAVNLICWQALAEAGVHPAFVCGHSLGEYSALCAAGVLSVADTFRLVTARGRLMQREADRQPGGMAAVLGLTVAELEARMNGWAGPGIVTVANHNSERQIVVSGGADAVAEAGRRLGGPGVKVVPLKVAGAMHSPLMAGMVADFAELLAATPVAPPATAVLFNVSAGPEADPAAIRAIMAQQIVSRVRWLEIMEQLSAAGVDAVIEVGPKTVLSNLWRKSMPKGCPCQVLQVEDQASLARCLEALAARGEG